MNIPYIDGDFIEQSTNFATLVEALKDAFAESQVIVPQRAHYDFPNGELPESTLLTMPAWEPGKEAGVKVVTVSPDNAKKELPSIHGTYLHLDASTGRLKSILDATALTAKRTAAASALASSFLSRKDSKRLLMIGTGALSENLIRAHAAVRPIESVLIYGRNTEKAQKIADRIADDFKNVGVVSSIQEGISNADIISCATLSPAPLIRGEWLSPGQHVDLVGSYRPTMREADDQVLLRSNIFADTRTALIESGDLAIPLKENVISENDLNADLFELSSGRKTGRTNDEEITTFKSVGFALEDLIGAQYYYTLWNSK